MNIPMIRFVIGRILKVEAGLLAVPLFVSFLYGESWKLKLSFLIPMAILIGVGFLFTYKKPQSTKFYARDGMVMVALIWILMSLFGALPLSLSGEYASLVDGFFEISSGFTTTGASVHTNVESLSHSILFWRSFTHLIGGMGVLVFALALFPKNDADNVYIMKAEVPGPIFGKLVSKLGSTARILYGIYLVLTAIVVILLLFGGMDLFESLCHAFGAAGTGGFGIKNTSVLYYQSAYIDVVLGVAMLVFGMNFNLFYLLLLRHFKKFFSDEELKWYAIIVVTAIVLISINVWPMYESFWKMLQDVFFTVSSIVTTTGYSTVDFDAWPLFSHVVLLLLMFIGSMAGSTAGGLKVSRIVLFGKSIGAEKKRVREPNRVAPVTMNGAIVPSETLHSVLSYLAVYAFLFFTIVLVISWEFDNFISAFSAVAATFNNIGPGLGVVGPTGSYASMHDFSKIVLSFAMIAGRLELWPVLILFSRRTWRKV